jgi:hypothetical protein
MKKILIIIALVVAALGFIGYGVYNYGRNLLDVATQEMRVNKPAPTLTQEYKGGLIHYVK